MSRIVHAPRESRAAAKLREAWAVEETRRLAALGDRVALAELRALEVRERGDQAPPPPDQVPAIPSPAIAGGRARLARAGVTLVRMGLDPKIRPELRELAATMATLVRRIELVESGAADQVAGDGPTIAAEEASGNA